MCPNFSVCGNLANCFVCAYGGQEKGHVFKFGFALVNELISEERFAEAREILEDIEAENEEAFDFEYGYEDMCDIILEYKEKIDSAEYGF